MSQTPAALADLLRAFANLQPEDDAARAAIASLLGVSPVDLPAEPPPPPPPRPPEDRREEQDGATGRERQEPPEPRRHAPRPPSWEEPRERAELSAVLKPDFTTTRRPDWLERVAPLEESDTEAPPAVPIPDPLFDPRWTRALLSGSLATFSETGPLDVLRLVRGVARGAPWRSVPRRPWPTLARGVQVLVDRGDAMLPFAADQDGLLEKLRLVVGKDLIDVLRFDGCPSRGAGAGPRRVWAPYFEHHRPRPGAAVLALTDLGIGGCGLGTRPVRPDEWRVFTEELHRSGCPLLAFVPYGRERWPAELTGLLKILPWDRTTSVRTVRRAIGKALAAPRGPR